MFEIACPQCGASTSLSFVEPVYEGPFRCWKCKRAFLVAIENGVLKSSSPITAEQLGKYME
jgi:transposase-like protein